MYICEVWLLLHPIPCSGCAVSACVRVGRFKIGGCRPDDPPDGELLAQCAATLANLAEDRRNQLQLPKDGAYGPLRRLAMIDLTKVVSASAAAAPAAAAPALEPLFYYSYISPSSPLYLYLLHPSSLVAYVFLWYGCLGVRFFKLMPHIRTWTATAKSTGWATAAPWLRT